MSNRYKTPAEIAGAKRRTKAYQDKLRKAGMKARQYWVTDAENAQIKPAGYRNLRQEVFEHGLKRMFSPEVELLREPRADQYGVRAVLSVNGQPIKFEVIREGRIAVEGELVEGLPVPCLSRNDLYTEKLLANADRWADKSVMSRDIIDLAMMIHRWGALPEAALQKAQEAYGETVMRSFENATKYLRERPERLKECIRELAIDDEAAGQLQKHFKPLKRSLGLER